MSSTDTIAAIATPSGRGGVGVVRVSGPRAAAIAVAVAGEPLPETRKAVLRRFRDRTGAELDEGLVLWFPGPGSFTGEDVVEFQGHGGPVVLDLLLACCLHYGARLAHPGEFSERAFLNGRMDLAQAEAIADLIEADTEAAARSAVRTLQGEFSHRVTDLTDRLTELRVYVESAIDFSDEPVDFLSQGAVAERIADLQDSLSTVLAAARHGTRLRDGMTVVLAGQPNAGKSSLLNALAGRESAIVTEVPGTTRDVLRERIAIDGMPLHVIDTAGLREGADRVEAEGIRRAWDAIAEADRVLLVVDAAIGFGAADRAILAHLPAGLPITAVMNKVDLTSEQPHLELSEVGDTVYLSAQSGDGVDLLRDHLKAAIGFLPAGEGEFTARRRHLEALGEATEHLEAAAIQTAMAAPELIAEELRLAQQALGTITGEVTADDLLGRIFSTFCIGK